MDWLSMTEKTTYHDYVESICEIFGVNPKLCVSFKIEPDTKAGVIRVEFTCIPDSDTLRQMIHVPMPDVETT